MKRQEGSVILLVLLVSAVFAVLAPVAGTIATSEARIARSHAVQTTALYIAEAGVELAIARLREEPGFTTPAGNPISGGLNGGSYTVSVSGGSAALAERIIDSTGVWGGGQRRAAARVSFSPAQAPPQSFLFQHTFLSGGTAEIQGSTISGPVRVGGLDEHGNSPNKFTQEGQPVVDPQAGGRIPAVDFRHYVDLALDNRDQWYVVGDANRVLSPDSNDAADLDAAVRAANALIPRRERILINAGDNETVKLSLRGNDPPANFHGLIVIRAKTVKFEDNINAYPNNNNPLVILTTGDIVVPTGQGHRVDTLGNNTLLYSNGRVEIERSEGGGVRQMSGIVVAKGGNKDSELRNTYLAYNNAMLHLLQQDAQLGFRQQAATTVMNVTFTSPGP
ncbi:MAG: pilus assembly PilX N-terminal domain-containing protein [Firmicutes bacterium]|nr:pilus assembly PilX N-terminal domain-containing protein [Bacillota bacterium]